MFFNLLQEGRALKRWGVRKQSRHYYLCGMVTAFQIMDEEIRGKEINMTDYGALDASADRGEP